MNCLKCGAALAGGGAVYSTKICSDCIKKAVQGDADIAPIPQRVGIARRGDLVILECKRVLKPEESARVADMLDKVKKETGVCFLVLEPSFKLARTTSEGVSE